ncbi:MAG: DUF983 domain-containing protein [Flavobacteriales bacterium]
MFKKGTKLYSIFKRKCPHCHEGQFFESNNPYNLNKVGNLLNECPVCKNKYEIEPGFYYGAMYVSYALGIATLVSAFVAVYILFPDTSTEIYIGTVVASIFILGPVLYQLSKIIWANMFISYEESFPKKA